MTGESYQALFKVWRDKALTVRVAYSLGTQGSGREFDEIKATTALLPMGLGDDMLRFNGIGERITGGMYNNDKPTPGRQGRVLPHRAVGGRARPDADACTGTATPPSDNLLSDLRARQPARCRSRRCAGRSRISTTRREQTLRRMKALGVGWTMQDAMYFGGEAVPRAVGRAVGAPHAAGRHRQEDRRRRRRRHRRASRRLLQSVHRAAVVPRRQDRRRRRDARAGGDAGARRRAAPLHDRQRVVLARRRCARLARGREAGRPGGAVAGLHDGAGRTHRRDSSRCSRWSAARSSTPRHSNDRRVYKARPARCNGPTTQRESRDRHRREQGHRPIDRADARIGRDARHRGRALTRSARRRSRRRSAIAVWCRRSI